MLRGQMKSTEHPGRLGGAGVGSPISANKDYQA